MKLPPPNSPCDQSENARSLHESALFLVAGGTQKEGCEVLLLCPPGHLTTETDCFLKTFRAIRLPEARMIGVSKVYEKSHSIGVFFVQEAKQPLI